MADILDPNSFRNWNNGETMNEADYEQERAMLIAAVNVINTLIAALNAPGAITADKLANGSVGNAHLDAGLAARVVAVEADATKANTDLATHKTSTDHDGRYYNKTEIDTQIVNISRGGDTVRRVEVFTIVEDPEAIPNSFTYMDSSGVSHLGALGPEGQQQFALLQGSYTRGDNLIEAIINDTLHRSAASGGLTEDSETRVSLVDPQAVGTEVTFVYFERIGVMAGSGLIAISDLQPTNSSVTWFKVVG